MWIATLVLGLGMLAVPERSMAARPIGIDVSDYQSASINWVTLKNTYGISFGWAKISEGTASGSGSGGGNFTTYAANAKAAGVLIGAYHYARYD
jgi:GH25 family lysozyme M1 (1,4-beta-N-acetylmuramidase)